MSSATMATASLSSTTTSGSIMASPATTLPSDADPSTGAAPPPSPECQGHTEEYEMQQLPSTGPPEASCQLSAQGCPAVPERLGSSETVADKGPKTCAPGDSRLSLTRIAGLATVLAFLLAIAFGVGGWQGMNYANRYAKSSYEVAIYQLCLSPVYGIRLPKIHQCRN